MINESKKTFSKFTNKYPLSKTLRFELKSVAETKKYLQNFIDSDTKRAEEYKELKKIIDEFHKDYIEKSLSSKDILNSEDLKKLHDFLSDIKKLQLYKEKNTLEKKINDLQKSLRLQIVKQFKGKKELFEKKLIKETLPNWLNETTIEDVEHKKAIVEKFKDFTTYLTGFHNNRKNMYSDKEQSTAIAHRIINENLPRFLSNIEAYRKISEKFPELKKDLQDIKTELKEEFNYFKISNIPALFEESFFNKCLTQTGIDNYNFIIGGKALENGNKIKGINERINLYRQKKRKEQVKISSSNLPLMQILYKQILSEGESHSFYDREEFNNRKDVLEALHGLWTELFKKRDEKKLNILENIANLFTNIFEENYDLDKIYFKKSSLSQFSASFFEDYSFVQNALNNYSEKTFSKQKEKENWLKKDFFSFNEINKAIYEYQKENDDNKKEKSEASLQVYFKSELTNKKEISTDFITYIESLYKNITKIPENSQTEFNTKEVEGIQVFLQSLMEFLHLIKPVYLEESKTKISHLDKDNVFYPEFESFFNKLKACISVYNKTRNYITQNKNRLKKVKINFEDSTLLNGWDVNRESANLSVILRKEGVYYLAIMNTKNRKLFDYQLNFDDYNKEKAQKIKGDFKKTITEQGKEKYYEKLNYKLLPDPSKDLPRVCFSNKHISHFAPSKKILQIREKKTYAKNDGEEFNLTECRQFIDFYKESIKKHYDWNQFNFQFSDTSKYNDISDFYQEVSSQGYKLSFDKIKSDYIYDKIQKGELYMFQIYNKDFSTKAKNRKNSRDNLHTSYFKLLFEKENLEDIVFKLNGQAEVFYRKATKKFKITHKKNEPIENKNKENPKKTSTFDYDLIKDKRFTEDKYFFHVPVTLNFKTRGLTGAQFNQETLNFLKDNKDINIIGIDRGERHLAYYTVINQEGDILKQGSFNNIISTYKDKNNKIVKVDTPYHKLLEEREKERDNSRKSWNKIESIKELKAGYLSHLVHQISRLMLEYNAIVIFEDLNKGFKRGRMKFEKQVYQKLEKALIDKLNYLAFKDQPYKKSGGFLNAYQLTAPFETFQKMGKQTGFLFYVPAYYTSKVDPLTGFVNLIYPKYENIKKSKSFFESFESIFFDKKKDYFVFEYSDAKINPKRKTESRTFWKVCTHSPDRYKYNKKERSYEPISVTKEITKLFDRFKIDYKSEKCIKKEIVKQSESSFFKELTALLNLTVQLRHINPKGKISDEKDFILSPVADKNGRFFDSRKAKEQEPRNADANGAYHIALKGLITVKNITADEKDKFKIQSITNKDWFEFIRHSKLNNEKTQK